MLRTIMLSVIRLCYIEDDFVSLHALADLSQRDIQLNLKRVLLNIEIYWEHYTFEVSHFLKKHSLVSFHR